MLSTVDEIRNLVMMYSQFVDSGDAEGSAKLFAHGRRTTAGLIGNESRGIEAMREYFTTMRIYDDGTPKTQHVITNVIIEVDEPTSTARARCYFHLLQETPDLGLQVIAASSIGRS